MNHALYAAASGMAAQQTNLDVIANNLANADVAGFKGAAAPFTDLGTFGASGLGTTSLGAHTVFSQGKLMKGAVPSIWLSTGQASSKCTMRRDGVPTRATVSFRAPRTAHYATHKDGA